MTLTRRRVRVSKYIILVNRIGTKMGTYFIIINIIVIKQLLKSSKWRCRQTYEIEHQIVSINFVNL
jgi:hypothetical protein